MEAFWSGALQLRDYVAEGLGNCLGAPPELETAALRGDECLGGLSLSKLWALRTSLRSAQMAEEGC